VTQRRPETLAHHFTEAGLFERAVGYWCRAGRRSVAKSGFVEAITQLRTGLRLIPDLPDTRERKQQELELQIALAGALTVIKGYAHPEVAEAFGRARSLISETGRAGTVIHFSMLRGLWAAEFVGGKPRAALDRANEFLLLVSARFSGVDDGALAHRQGTYSHRRLPRSHVAPRTRGGVISGREELDV
jgi:hypothetical protein